VVVFYFPETATVGERINNEVFRRLQEHDRVILVCSRAALDRPGVLNEIQETLDREARDGGASYLLPVMLDDYVLTGWRNTQPELAERVGRRVVADFRKASRNRRVFDAELARLLDALKITGRLLERFGALWRKARRSAGLELLWACTYQTLVLPESGRKRRPEWLRPGIFRFYGCDVVA
jgi:hypothetical protein